MRLLIRIAVIGACLASLNSGSFAQGLNSTGTDFWLSFMPNGPAGGVTRLRLFISSTTKNVVRVDVGGVITTQIMQPNGVVNVTLGSNAIATQAEIPTSNAIHVSSQNPISVVGYSVWGNSGTLGGSPDGYLGLPITSYGKKYYTVNFPTTTFGSDTTSGEFVIIAPYDHTHITINPKGHTRNDSTEVSHRAGQPWTVELMRGQTYLVQSSRRNIGDNDLTGSLVTSDRPISVITGHQISQVGNSSASSADHLCEMLPPVDRWGTQYYEMPMTERTQAGDFIRIMSAEDGNIISSGGIQRYFLNAGEYVDLDRVTEPVAFTSNGKKYLVAMYAYSQGFSGDPAQADPFLVLLTPREQFQKRMLFSTPANALDGSFTNYVTFVGVSDSIRKIKINGVPITSYWFNGNQQFPFTNPVMSGYRIKLSGDLSRYRVESNAPIGAYQYGYSAYEGYGWPTGTGQNISSRDTLPPLATLGTSANGVLQIAVREDRTISTGFSFDDVGIASISLITDSGDLRSKLQSHNVQLIADSNFVVGDPLSRVKLQVVDTLQDAFAALYTIDLAGNDSLYQFHYTAPKATRDSLPPWITAVRTGRRYNLIVHDSRRRTEGFSFDDSGIESVDLTNDTNIQFTMNQSFRSGDSLLVGSLASVDTTRPAAGSLHAVDVAGNDTTFVFSIDAGKVVSGGVVSIGQSEFSISIRPEADGRKALRMHLPVASAVRIEMFDLTGRAAGDRLDNYYVAGDHTLDLHTEALANGVYLLRVTAGEHVLTTRLVIGR